MRRKSALSTRTEKSTAKIFFQLNVKSILKRDCRQVNVVSKPPPINGPKPGCQMLH